MDGSTGKSGRGFMSLVYVGPGQTGSCGAKLRSVSPFDMLMAAFCETAEVAVSR
jgi:hypothetical protein